MIIPCPVDFASDTAAAQASKIIANWHFVASGADGYIVAQAKGETAEKAVEKLREILCLSPAKFKKIRYSLYLVHPETHIQGLFSWHPEGCKEIFLGFFSGAVNSDS